MKNTRANVEERAIQQGLIPIQIDGIPEGFSFKESDISIGGTNIIGEYIAFIPLTEQQISSTNQEDLIDTYKTLCQSK